MKKGEATRQAILHQSAQLFTQHGYHGVTMQMICEKTGLSKGGLYRYFPNIDAIFLEILRQAQAEHVDLACAMMEQGLPAAEILGFLLQPLRGGSSPSGGNGPSGGLALAMYEFFASHRQDASPQFLADQFARGHRSWQSLIEYGCRTGDFRVAEPNQAATLILFALEGLRMCAPVMDVTAMEQAVACQIEALLGVRHG